MKLGLVKVEYVWVMKGVAKVMSRFMVINVSNGIIMY